MNTTVALGDVHPPSPSGEEPHCDPRAGCITCGDVAEEMRVVRIDSDRELALCEHSSGEKQTVEIALVQPVAEADTLLVHAGTAITNLGRPVGDPGGADAGADQEVRGEAADKMFKAGAEHPPGVIPEDVAGVVL